jgi:hypothetical protein
MKTLRYCAIASDDGSLQSHGLAALSGFFQWSKAFQGDVRKGPDLLEILQDGLYDVIHLCFTGKEGSLIRGIRAKIGEKSLTKILVHVDLPYAAIAADWASLDGGSLLCADLVLTQGYGNLQGLQKKLGKKVYEIHHPVDIPGILRLNEEIGPNRKKRFKKSAKPSSFAGFCLNNPISLLFYFCLHSDTCAQKKLRNAKRLIRTLNCLDIILLPRHSAHNETIAVFAAVLGRLAVGSHEYDSLRICFPSSTVSSRSFRSLAGSSLFLLSSKALLEDCLQNARAKAETYNWGNSIKRLMDILYAETHDPRFLLELGEFKNRRDEIVYFHNFRHEYGRKANASAKNLITVVCLVKNGAHYAKTFMDHYQGLGCDRFIFIDNGSSDNTAQILGKYENATVYTTDLSFRNYESEIRREVINSLCRGQWCLCVDIDELFEFPRQNRIGLDGLLRYMSLNGFTAAIAHMLDMYPRMIDFSPDAMEEKIKDTYCYYDTSDIKSCDYFDFAGVFNAHNSLSKKNIPVYFGGVRGRSFKAEDSRYLLTKHPLIFIDNKIDPFTNPHFSNKAAVADITCLLRHYKFTPRFKETVLNGKNEYEYYANREYQAYDRALRDAESLSLYNSQSKKFGCVDDLIGEGFISVSQQYELYCNEFRRKK